MKKFIIPFNDDSAWERDKCELCRQSDSRILHILDLQKRQLEEQKNVAIQELENILVDGYRLAMTAIRTMAWSKSVDREVDKRIFNYLYENYLVHDDRFKPIINSEHTTYRINYSNLFNGFHYLLGNVGLDDTLQDLINEKEYNFYSLNKKTIGTDEPVVLYSRWCARCGARKPDIYDSAINERMDLLPITNFFCLLKNNKIYITWTDTKSFSFAYSKLWVNGNATVHSYNEHKDEPKEIIDVENDVLYSCFVENYDKEDNIIARSSLRYVLNETRTKQIEKQFFYKKLPTIEKTEIKNDVLPLTDFTAWQETILVPYKSGDEPIFNNNIIPRAIRDSSPISHELEIETKPVTQINVDAEQVFQCKPCSEKKDERKIIRWVRKSVIVSSFTPTSPQTLIRRSTEEVPGDIDRGFECSYPFQEIDERDLRTWYLHAFPVSRTYTKRILNGFQFYNDINYSTSPIEMILKPLTVDCTLMKCVNKSKYIDLTWNDPYINWSKTQVYMREYTGLPIWRKTDAELIYESTIVNKHKTKPFRIENLINGKSYQIGIFPVTRDGIVFINPIQLTGQPRYIRPKHVINYDFVYASTYEPADKDIYMINPQANAGDFSWDGEKWVTQKSTVFWFETAYPLVEGGILTFSMYCTYPCIITVYSNRANIFTTRTSTNTLHWEKFSIDVPPVEYCKLIVEIQSKYSGLKLYIKDMEFTYKTGVEKFI